MSKQTVAGHIAIAVLASLVGYAAYGLNRMGCVYAKQPFGAVCSPYEDHAAFLQAALPVALVFYVVWGVILLLRREEKKA